MSTMLKAIVRWSVRPVERTHRKDTSNDGYDQSALLDLLAALKDTDVSDRIRTATEHLNQELIDAEVTAVIGTGRW